MATKKRRVVSRKFYNQRTLHKEREYGFYWYSWLWKLVRPLLIFTISTIITVGIFVNGWFAVYDYFLKPMDPDNQATVPFVIEKGNTVTKIASNLSKQGLLRNQGIFKYMVMFRGVTSDIQYGTYQISPSMTTSQIIDIISSGTSSVERTIKIIPGWTVEDIAVYLFSINAITDVDEFYRLCNSDQFVADSHQVAQAAASESASHRKYLLEGYLAPDTYRVFANASADSLIRTLLGQTEIVMDKLYASIEAGADEVNDSLPTLTQDEIIILASIIEKEAVLPEDRGKVSAVFYNRLAAGMKLESDPTVKYITGSTDFILSSEDLELATPYNTYVIDGLPAGPICNPSPAALQAALHPNQNYIDEGYLFFCSTDPHKGELFFSKTLEEHNEAVAMYKPLWEEYDAEQRAAREAGLAPTATPEPTSGT